MPAKRRTSGRRNRSKKNFVAIRFAKTLALSTLASATVLKGAIITPTRDLFIISVDAVYGKKGGTPGEGPLEVGYSHGDYTVAEIKENLVVDMSDPGDKIAYEQGRRLVRVAGAYQQITEDEVIDNGRTFRKRIGFQVNEDKSFDLWARNNTSAALTTGTTYLVTGTIYGRWI